MNEIINKINNNGQQQSQPLQTTSPKSVLTPTPLFDVHQFQTSKSVIDLFDPLAQVEADGSPVYVRITSSPIPPPPEPTASQSDSKSSDDVKNNNISERDRSDTADGNSHRNSYRTSLDEPINLLQVEERKVKYAADLQEFFEHLRALYLSIGSKNSSLSNCGLVWSPRIDIAYHNNITTADTYMCSPATKKQQSMSLSSSNSSGYDDERSEKMAIFDIRFNALVYAKLSGAQVNTFELTKLTDSMWHSKKLSCALDNMVEMIITHVSYNVERSDGSKDVS